MLAQHTTSPGNHVHRVFTDGFGRRYKSASRESQDTLLEILCFRHEITDVPSFEFALRERVSRLSHFHHPDFAFIRKVDRLNDEHGTVALMSDGVKGMRLSDVLADADRLAPTLDLDAAVYVVQQLCSAIASLHEQMRVAHGAISPERILITPLAKICITEHAMGAAVEQLRYSRERYWRDLRVALPESAGLPRLDERADVAQIGVVMLSLLLGRAIRDDEYPAQLDRLVTIACSHTAEGAPRPLPGMRDWLRRALNLEPRRAFRSAAEARTALDEFAASDTHIRANMLALEMFLHRYNEWTHAAPAAAMPAPVLDGLTRFEASAEEEPAPVTESVSAPDEFDEVDESAGEEGQPMTPTRSAKATLGRFKWIAAGLVVAVLTTAGLFAMRRFSPAAPAVVNGTVTINTNPPGAEVQVDGVTRGRTPLSVSLASGAHTLTVRGADGEPRTIPVNVTAGAESSHHLELPKATAQLGQLNVRTEPAGAKISIDGTPMGKTPMTIVELVPGEHVVTLENDMGTVTQKVVIEAGVPAALMVPMTGAAGSVASGWISVNAPVVMDLLENGRLLGTSGIDRLMLSVGKHEIEIVSEALGYREVRTVQVVPGRVSPINVTLPKGVVSINAIPWATVSIDGENVGDTPIGNLPLTIGPHEVVFRNSEHGEQRRVVTVTTRGPVRLSVDMAKK